MARAAAIVISPGVVVDEARAFRQVLSRLPETTVVGIGSAPGVVRGAGGSDRVDVAFSALVSPDIIAVPGAIGVRQHAAEGDLMSWLRAAGPTSQWVIASSTGAVVVAAAGLLSGLRATTHWLATPLLASYGAEASPDRIVTAGKVLTCQGRVSAVDLGLHLAREVGGQELVDEIRAELLAGEAPVLPVRWWHRFSRWHRADDNGITVIDLEAL